ncbi:MAG: hypothetical protein ABI662_12280 [Dermatophilaceae bacterium]
MADRHRRLPASGSAVLTAPAMAGAVMSPGLPVVLVFVALTSAELSSAQFFGPDTPSPGYREVHRWRHQ